MALKPKTCKPCPLYKLALGFVRPVVPVRVLLGKLRLLVQGEAPASNEIEEDKPFAGRAGHWQRHNIMANAGLTEEQVWYDNTLRCWPPKNKTGAWYPVGEARSAAEDNCRQYDQWSAFPKSIPLLLVGGKAAGMYFEHDRIGKLHGHIETQDKRLIGATFHPSAVMRNPNLLPVAIRETMNLLVAAKNPAVLARPTVFKGFYALKHDKEMVVDLEWNVKTDDTTVLGISQHRDRAYSSFAYEEGMCHVDYAFEKEVRVIGHNFICADLPRCGNQPESFKPEHIIDTQVVGHLIHAHLAELQMLSLGSLVRMYEPTPAWKDDKSDLLLYNGYDCAYNYRLWKHLEADLTITNQWHLVEKQQRLASLSHDMRAAGIRVDSEAIRNYAKLWKIRRDKIAKEFPFNPNSPKQVKEWARNENIPLNDTKKETLIRVAARHPVLQSLVDFKEEGKTIKVWFNDEAAEKGYIHPQYHVTGTAVARFSCSGPNTQNIPPHLRHIIIPEYDGMELVAFDGSQIENRCIAWLAQDKQMLADFASGMDFHTLSASRIFDKRPADITKAERQTGKITVHATNYGETPYNLSKRLFGNAQAPNLAKARALQAAYFKAYPRIREWQKEVSKQLDSGNITLRNPFGRVRFVYAQSSHDRMKRGCHYLGCSTAADIWNQRALDVEQETYRTRPLLIVHDELVFQLRKDNFRRQKLIKEIMEQPVPEMDGLIIPTGMSIGPNYGAMVEMLKK